LVTLPTRVTIPARVTTPSWVATPTRVTTSNRITIPSQVTIPTRVTIPNLNTKELKMGNHSHSGNNSNPNTIELNPQGAQGWVNAPIKNVSPRLDKHPNQNIVELG